MSFWGGITSSLKALEIYLAPGWRARFREKLDKNETFKLMEKVGGPGSLVMGVVGLKYIADSGISAWALITNTPSDAKSLKAALEKGCSEIRDEIKNISSVLMSMSKVEREDTKFVVGPLEDINSNDLMNELLRRMKCSGKPDKRVIFVGPPGSGKSTQSSSIKDEFCLCHLTAHNVQRAAIALKTPFGTKAKEAFDKGKLLSVDLLVGMIGEALQKPSCRKGFILDGFPTTLVEARKLDEMLENYGVKIDKVLHFAIDDAIAKERIIGRWIHPASGRTYHTRFAPSKVLGVDDVTGEPLIHSKDDTVAVLKSRLEAYHTQTELVIDYYSKQSIITHLDAVKPPKYVTDEVHKLLSS